MKNLIKVVSERAQKCNLQVIFTTHRESIIELSDLINIRHIFGTSEKTLCFDETKPDAINRLTGTQPRLIEVFVEDDLAVAIIRKVAGQLGISRHVSIQRFGAAINCFTVLAGLRLRGENCDHSMFVLDGDVYRTEEEQEKRLEFVLTGNDEHAKSLRKFSLERIKCLNLPENTKPEKYIHSIIVSLEGIDNNEFNEIIKVARQIEAVDDSHKYVDDIITRLDLNRDVGLSKIIDLFSSTQAWSGYVANVKDWLDLQIPLVEETTSHEV